MAKLATKKTPKKSGRYNECINKTDSKGKRHSIDVRECRDVNAKICYEIQEDCRCNTCMERIRTKKLINRIVISTYDKEKINEAIEIILKWECCKKYYPNSTFNPHDKWMKI